MIDALKKVFTSQSDLVLVIAVVSILMILFMPIPSELLDFLLIANISLALLILLLTFYVEKPLQFSTFPSLLLIATLFRLSLNIAATRLILSDADAGEVIATIGAHVVGGNYVIGMIVFLVLIVVQYVVVTNGAQRVAEVAARFTLDAMPGKQMSIDADLNMGLIDERQAQQRREQIEKEASFYGAMDGASKFVKGDAIAGIVIILIDIIGGLTIGIAQLGMSWGDALETYTLLTIGDGIVTQIPALVIATGTGIIVTRAASDRYLSREITGQITAFPKILGLVAAVLAVALFVPGIPALPVMILLSLVGVLFVIATRARRRREVEAETETGAETPADENLYDSLAVEPLEIKVGQNLVPLLAGDDSLMMDRIAIFRKQYALEIGFVMPKVRARDDKSLPPNGYQIRVYDAPIGDGEILPDRILAIDPGNVREPVDGIETRDPTYRLPAVWIVDEQRDAARRAGYTLIEPLHVLMTHITETVRQQAANLLTRAETERLIEHIRQRNASLVEELIPAVLSLSDIQKVLQRLLREKVSIRNLEMILEILVDEGKQSKDPERLTEAVRQRLGAVICQPLVHADGKLNVLVLDPGIEQALAGGVRKDVNQGQLVVEPRLAEQVIAKISAQVEKMLNADLPPVLLCAPELRAHLRRFTERILPQLAVVSMNEVPTTVDVKSFAMVTL